MMINLLEDKESTQCDYMSFDPQLRPEHTERIQ